ncbi:unnamed protein product [Cylicocyclus nassatus]|uniref:Uncharacterized protein n=1 Tax=Cylicocyclus nassatus TaxID=53992 RepID=A0AA36GN53_CYLNA|nr:unnamed protein product [Cylicocyclus nassatus]
MNTFTLFVLLLLSAEVKVNKVVNAVRNCYKDWSRCTPGTNLLTGIAWKTCPEFCRKCKGRASGRCEKTKMTICGGGYFCNCIGGSYPKATDKKTVLECKHGL